MNIDFLEAKEHYKRAFLDIKDLVNSRFRPDEVRITLGDHYQLSNTPLYLVLEFHAVGKESEDDYGLCLSVSYQHYNPTLSNLIISERELFVNADLSRASGEGVSYFGLSKLDLDKIDFRLDLDKTEVEITSYFKSQVPVIIELLENDYLK